MKQTTSVAIIGGAAKKSYFPKNYKGQIWGINGGAGWRAVPGFHVLFNIHRYKLLKKYGYDFKNETDRANDGRLLITADKWPTMKKGVAQYILPVKLMARDMPRGHYHCGSADWLVAYAVWATKFAKKNPQQFKQIDLHGWNLVLEAGEPISARGCLEYWCGYAEGLGIKVNIAPDCGVFCFYHLVKSKRTYGYDDCPMFEDKTRKGMPYDYRD